MKTYSAKALEIDKKWLLVDAEGAVLGRLASFIAMRLRGKHKATYTPHLDCGDNIIVINARKVRLTGNKLRDKKFHYHTGHPGGIKERIAGHTLAGAHPERLLSKAVQRMLPHGPLGRQQLSNLRIYADAEHPHAAQAPQQVDFKSLNRKNTRIG
ncbi:MAG: 50S ribosomal protein L13 [Pseudomonadota bacterium]|jgi:large subunit ribosomal protein L13